MPGWHKESDQKLRGIFTAAIPFVMARRKTTGGFGATPRLPASIEDTYHALNIISLARQYNAADRDAIESVTENNLLSYLAACRRFVPAGAKITFQLLWCCRIAGLEFDPAAVETAIVDKMRTSASRQDWYSCARILIDVLGGKLPATAKKPNLAAILDRDWRSVDEAWMHMYLSQGFRNTSPQAAPELIAWFRACQNGDGGFGFFPGTTSFIENCHTSLLALTFLGAAPLHPNRAFRFLAGCQTASGGFGRGLRAAPFLDATWHALAALAIL